jgi:hypothetical protein
MPGWLDRWLPRISLETTDADHQPAPRVREPAGA